MSEIVRHEPQALGLPEQMQYAEIVTKGDMIPQSYRNKPANALIAIGLGQAMGLSPAESLYRIDVIQGKPAASGELIAANVRKAGHKLRVETDATKMSVTATIYRADDPGYAHVVTRDMQWAKDMGLTNKDQYKKQPLTMLEWRAISACARKACSEALYGVQYVIGEVEDTGERRAPAASAVDRLRAAAQPEPEADVVTGEVQEPMIPEEVVAAVERATNDDNLPAYLDWLIEREAPAHILTYVKERI